MTGRTLSLVGLAFAAACSGEKASNSSNAAAASGKPANVSASSVETDNTCQMLTRSEAQAALGSSIERVGDEGEPSPVGTMLRSSCFYSDADGGTLTLTTNTYPDAQEATEKFERMRRMYGGARAVSGLGDEALVNNQDLIVRKGNVHVMVNLDPEGSNKITDYSDMQQMDKLLAVERQVADRAISRLPRAQSPAVAAAKESQGACAYMSKAEMEAVLGGSLSHAVPSGVTCTYTGAGGLYAQVTVDPQGGETAMAGAKLAGALMGQASGVKATTPVEGLGDEAVMVAGGILNVRKGAALVAVDLRTNNNAQAKGRAIAERVLSRM